jgi:hypothetical protein
MPLLPQQSNNLNDILLPYTNPNNPTTTQNQYVGLGVLNLENLFTNYPELDTPTTQEIYSELSENYQQDAKSLEDKKKIVQRGLIWAGISSLIIGLFLYFNKASFTAYLVLLIVFPSMYYVGANLIKK